MYWTEEMFGVPKPIIAMRHLRAMPGDPDYDPKKGMSWVIENARRDLTALQEVGVNGVMFSK